MTLNSRREENYKNFLRTDWSRFFNICFIDTERHLHRIKTQSLTVIKPMSFHDELVDMEDTEEAEENHWGNETWVIGAASHKPASDCERTRGEEVLL